MIRSYSIVWRVLAAVLLSAFLYSQVLGQAQLVLNGADITLAQGAYLVIDNPASTAITRTSGRIISESENNIVQWNIGTTTGTYTIPWGYSTSDYLPLTFTKSAGTGSGYFLFSTYHTGWQNSLQLPTGISNFNGGSGADKSVFATDRFWQINPLGYTAKPSLTNLTFTYVDSEFAAPNTTSTEANLSAQRWNSTTSAWTDYAPVATADASANTVTIASVADTDLYPWWVVNYIQDRHWTAATASNWNNPMNWSTTEGGPGGAGVPSSVDAVLFDDVRDASFTLDVNATMESLTLEEGYTGTLTQGAHTMTINSGATLAGGTFTGGSSDITINGPLALSGTAFTSTSGTLDLKGDFSFTGGTFAHNNGTVQFSGTTGVQDISGTTVGVFNNMTITNTSASPGVRIQSNQNVRGVLTLASNVVLDADGASNTSVFRLLSSADSPTQDASIAALPATAQISGSVTVQRYMAIEGPNGGTIYRYIASPVQNATVADLQNEIPITGSFTGTSVCSGCGTGQSLFMYNEAVTTDISNNGIADLEDGYIDFPDAANTETFVPGRGYALYVRGKKISTGLWDLRGTVVNANVTPVSFPVSYTSTGNLANDGWNLNGNPFPSTIDWNAASGWTKTNLETSIYIRDNGNATTQVATWNGVTGVNGGSRYIASGQGFWTKSNGAGTPVLQANEDIKVAGTQTTFFRERSLENLLRITMKKGTISDETVIHFREDATESFDANADARKLLNGSFNLSTRTTDGKKLAINSLSSFDCGSTVNVNVDNAAAGTYRLSFSEFESFPDNISIALLDQFTGSTINVRESAGYDFAVSTNPASYGADRFKVTFATPTVSEAFTLQSSDVCEETDAVVSIANTQTGVTYFASLDNTVISNRAAGNGNGIELIIPPANLQTGSNTVVIKAMVENCNTAVEKNVSFEVVQTIDPGVVSGKGCRENAVTVAASGGLGNGYYNWYESASAAMPVPGQHDSLFVTPVLVQTTTYYVAAVNALGCEGQRMPVQAEIVQLADVQITEDGDSLYSSYAEGNQWYFNHGIIAGATGRSVKMEQSGIYGVEVTVDGCTTTTEREFVITGSEDPASIVIEVHPNPASKEVFVEIPDAFPNLEEVRMINSIGNFIGLFELHQDRGRKTGRFDITDYPAGMYIVQVVGSTRSVEIKVIKK